MVRFYYCVAQEGGTRSDYFGSRLFLLLLFFFVLLFVLYYIFMIQQKISLFPFLITSGQGYWQYYPSGVKLAIFYLLFLFCFSCLDC